MPYAHNGVISQDPIEGGIEISQAQYQEAINGMLGGQQVTINEGFKVASPPAPEPPPQPEPPNPQPISIFSSLVYLQKFTTEEYAAARNHTNVSVQFGLDMLIAAQYVDLADPRVGMTLDLLVSEAVIAPERRTELLTPQEAA